MSGFRSSSRRASWARRIALLEPNARPGLTNRMLAPLVDEVWGAFAQADQRFANKYVHTGIPVRASLRSLPPRDAALERLGLSAKRSTLLAMGGSQGARSINDALTSLLKSDGLPEGWQLIHVTGEKEYDRVRAALSADPSTPLRYARDDKAVRPYLDDVSDAYAAADLVLARAGASTLGELAATGRPAILVPYPLRGRRPPAGQRRDGRAGGRGRRRRRPRADCGQAARRARRRHAARAPGGTACGGRTRARGSIRLRRFSPGSMR